MRQRQYDPAAVRFWVKLVAAWLIVLMLTVWVHIGVMGVERDLRQLRKEVDQLTYQNGGMQMQINQRESPSHLDVVARKELGMLPLDAAHVIGVHQP